MNASVREHLLKSKPPKTQRRDWKAILASAEADRAAVDSVLRLEAGDVVVDVGCGYGRLAAAFAKTGVGYVGLDVNKKRAAYAGGLYAPYTDCQFFTLPVGNDRYNPGGKRPEKATLPLGADLFAAAFAVSLFTHIHAADGVRQYLREISRILAPGGVLLSTWLTEPTGKASDDHRAWYACLDVETFLKEAGFETVSAEGAGTVESHLRVLSRNNKGAP